jgi:hypothetical protein
MFQWLADTYEPSTCNLKIWNVDVMYEKTELQLPIYERLNHSNEKFENK